MNSLYKLEDIGTTRSWDYEAPTLQVPGRFTQRSPMTNETFRTTFYHKFPAFEKMNWNNICLQGGAVVDMILGREMKDLDFFFYGLDDEESVLKRAHEFMDFLLTTERRYVEKHNQELAAKNTTNYSYRMKIIDIKGQRRGPVISVSLSSVSHPIQIVLCITDSMETLSRSADMAVTGIAFDGKEVLINDEAKWELENMSIKVRPGDSYPRMERLMKYFHKGFDVILPELDIEKIPKSYIGLGLVDAIKTRDLGFSYSAVDGNRISLGSFLTGKTRTQGGNVDKGNDYTGGGSSDYGGNEKEKNFNSRALLFENIKILANACRSKKKSVETIPSFAVYAEADFVCDVLKPWPDLTSRQITNTYLGISGSIYKNGVLNFGAFKKFLTVTSLADTLKRMSEVSDDITAHTQKVIDEAVQAQVAASNAMIVELREKFVNAKPPVTKIDNIFRMTTRSDKTSFYGSFSRDN